MKYGKLDEVGGIDFSLPADHPQTAHVLNGRAPERFEVRLGGTMWTVPSWKGRVYPNKLAQKDMAQWYCKQFGTIELNATHYKIHGPEVTARWADLADDDFRFCPKFPQLISHYRRFKNCEGLTDEFIEALLAMGKKCGPSFIQLPPNFSPTKADDFLRYIEKWPRELAVAVEFRHPDWFSGHAAAESVWQAMAEWGVGSVLSDTAGRRDAVHMRCTNDVLVLRFGGNDLHSTDAARFNDWAQRLVDWRDRGLQSVYVLMHQPDSVNTPQSCALFADALTARMDVTIKLPQPIEMGGLF